MLTRSKHVLASELMYARDFSEDEAMAFLEDVLADIHADERTLTDGACEPAAVA